MELRAGMLPTFTFVRELLARHSTRSVKPMQSFVSGSNHINTQFHPRDFTDVSYLCNGEVEVASKGGAEEIARDVAKRSGSIIQTKGGRID